MDVTAIGGAAATATATPATGASTPAAISSDFETFLKMLTTQMQNQDPLNPLDSNDFAVQLATFSGVEQQVRTNDLLEGLGSQLNLMGLSQLAGWVGREARVSGPMSFDGAPVSLFPSLPASADAAELVVSDRTGREVARGSFPVDADEVVWNGTDNAGTALPNGVYSFAIEATASGVPVTVQAPEHYARISEARNAIGGTTLILDGGIEVSATDILGLRAPG